jgi:hypothetical protein
MIFYHGQLFMELEIIQKIKLIWEKNKSKKFRALTRVLVIMIAWDTNYYLAASFIACFRLRRSSSGNSSSTWRISQGVSGLSGADRFWRSR